MTNLERELCRLLTEAELIVAGQLDLRDGAEAALHYQPEVRLEFERLVGRDRVVLDLCWWATR